MNNEEKQKESLKSIFIQFIKFGLVGVSNTIVSGGIYFLFNQVLFPGIWFLASVVSWVISVFWAFMLQNMFVLDRKSTRLNSSHT